MKTVIRKERAASPPQDRVAIDSCLLDCIVSTGAALCRPKLTVLRDMYTGQIIKTAIEWVSLDQPYGEDHGKPEIDDD